MVIAMAAEIFEPLNRGSELLGFDARQLRQDAVNTIERICGILYAEEIDLPALAMTDDFRDCGYTAADDSDFDEESWDLFAETNGLGGKRPWPNVPASIGDHRTHARIAYRNNLHIRTNRPLVDSLVYLSTAQLTMLAAYCENRFQLRKITHAQWSADPAEQNAPEIAIV